MIVKFMVRLLMVFGLLGAATGGFLVGQSSTRQAQESSTGEETLCTYYPVLPLVQTFRIEFHGREFYHYNYAFAEPEFSPRWSERYQTALNLYGIQTVVSDDTILIPCQSYADMDYLMKVTSVAGDGE